MTDRHPGTRTSSTSRAATQPSDPDLPHVPSGQRLDDSSVYHGTDVGSDKAGCDTSGTEENDEAEIVNYEDDEKARANGIDQIPEVRMGIPDTRDLEAGPAPSGSEKEKLSASANNPNLVTWDGPDDPQNPKNWTRKQKWAATFVVSSFTFISPVSSSMVAPALVTISEQFGITSSVEGQLVLSIFVLGYATGPLFFGPMSEIYGRVPVLQLGNLFYLVFNIACGVSRNKGEMIAFRFLSGLGGSAPLAIGGGVLSDCWRADERGAAISIYSLAPLLGPAVGPIMGGFITERTTWRWLFYATSIADGLIQLSGFFFLRETYPPKILKRKADRLRTSTGNAALKTEFEHPERTMAATLRRAQIRPFRLLGTQPIVQALALYMAYLYGVSYLVLSTIPTLWTDRYHESIGIGSLNYISLGLGFFVGAQTTARSNDRLYRRLKRRNNNIGRPEFRVPVMIPGSILVPSGLFIYGWAAQYHTHWIVPNIGLFLFAVGMLMGFQCIQTYLIDSYTRFAASAIGAAAVLRSLCGFGFPLFAPSLYDTLNYGWGNSLLGFIALGLGVPAPLLLWRFGPLLREKSTFAAGGGD